RNTAEPHVWCDAGKIRKVDQRGNIIADRVGYCTARFFDGYPLDPIRKVICNVLLEETRLVDSVWKALKHQRAIFDVRQHDIGNPFVIINDVLLSNSVLRKQYLVRPRTLDNA